MCGILGYIGNESASPILMDCLKNISYRGYDSSGLTLVGNGNLKTIKSVGPVAKLTPKVDQNLFTSTVGIAHTRWATHGEPTNGNAHPHTDCTGTIAVAHNGIIENFSELKQRLSLGGHTFKSETDTEVIPHLIENHMSRGLGLEEAVRAAALELEGAFAFVVASSRYPDQLLGVKYDCPLIVGFGSDNVLLTSDIAAVLDYCNKFVILENEQIVSVTRKSISLKTFSGDEVDYKFTTVDWDKEQAQKGGFEHFLLKEIHEQPLSVRDTLRGRVQEDGVVVLPELDNIIPTSLDKIVLVACGTASYACAFGKIVIEELTGLPVLTEVGSEFRYRRNFLSPHTLFIAVSQSGETADTIASLRLAKAAGARTLGIVNVVGTTIARESDQVIYTRSGPEVAVPSTKAFLSQLVAFELIALSLAQRLNSSSESTELAKQLLKLPGRLEQVLAEQGKIQQIAEEFHKAENWFVIGRGLDEPLAREGALKLKEVAYIHAESLPGGELKHGPIALIEKGMPVLALTTQPSLQVKTMNNIQEILARQGVIISITSSNNGALRDVSKSIIEFPSLSRFIDPVVALIPIQLIAYFAGILRGANVDHPRNLAKSVTVE
jgi:glucosamine--fructose-6-phosphate aminotransferase (isomerizing)